MLSVFSAEPSVYPAARAAMIATLQFTYSRISSWKRKAVRMTLTTQSLEHNSTQQSITSHAEQNVGPVERIASVAVGGAAIGYGLSRGSFSGLLLLAIGGALVHRGVTGRCYGYEALDINTRERNTSAGTRGADGIRVTQSVTVSRSPAEVYQFWRRLENLPRFMKHVESVEPIDDVRSRWVVKGPAGSQVEWTARILADRENKLISWESLPGAEVQNAGSVWFEPAANGGTEVRVILRYYPPTGRIGAAVAELFGEAPDEQLTEDLQRLKEAMEVGSVVRTKA